MVNYCPMPIQAYNSFPPSTLKVQIPIISHNRIMNTQPINLLMGGHITVPLIPYLLPNPISTYIEN